MVESVFRGGERDENYPLNLYEDQMSKEQFSVGDVVCLRSGSPQMTVMDVYTPTTGGKTTVYTSWFAGGAVQYSGAFSPGVLDLFELDDLAE